MFEIWSKIASVTDRAPDKAAILFSDRRISYRMLRDRSAKLAGSLWQLGLRPGDRVALISGNRPEYLELLFAVARIGAALVPLNARYGSHDLRVALRVCSAKILFAASHFRNQDLVKLVQEACGVESSEHGVSPGVPALQHIFAFDGEVGRCAPLYESLLCGDGLAPPLPSNASTLAALIIFTSGSSGFPKPVLLTQAQLVSAAQRVGERQGIRADDKFLSFLPYWHVYGGALTTLVPLFAGSTVVIQEAFDATQSLRAVQEHRCTVVYSVGPCWQAWLDHPELGSFDTTSIRTGICAAGASSSAAMAQRVQKSIGNMHSHYGMTETTGVATMTCVDDTAELATETAGRPLPGVEVAILDPETGGWLLAGVEGEICVRSDMMSPGYLDNVAMARLDAKGWFHTGDRGWIGKDGYLRVLGRLDDRLRSGGENIDPTEVEQFLAGHPAVANAFLVGVPDARLGEIPVAFVIGRDGLTTTEDQLKSYCSKSIAGFKVPRRVFFVLEVPGGLQKVQRFKLREEAVRLMSVHYPADSTAQP